MTNEIQRIMDKKQFMAMSLPFSLKCLELQHRGDKNGEIGTFTGYELDMFSIIQDIRLPILRPLSDYRELEDILGLIYCNEIFRVIKGWQKIEDLSFKIIQELVKNHFDICGLIEKGEAVDCHTLPDFVF